MTRAIPKWVMQRYSVLYREFRVKEFTREEARKAISKFRLKDDERLTNTFFSELHKRDWVQVSKDKNDGRKKLFKLINPEKGILELDLTEELNDSNKK